MSKNTGGKSSTSKATPAKSAPIAAATAAPAAHKEDQQQSEVPEHACAYCGYHTDVKCVAKCMDCNRWFCNGMNGMTVSHIVAHLAHGKHKKVALHPDSDVGGDTLECYVCEGQNIFNLGLATGRDGESALVCRDVCLHSEELAETGVDPETWSSLLENRRLADMLCTVPPQRSSYGNEITRSMDNKLVQMVEEGWREFPHYTAEQAIDVALSKHQYGSKGSRYRFPFVPKTFTDGSQMCDLYAPLVLSEMQCSKDLDAAFKLEGVKVEWSRCLGKPLASFTHPTEEHNLSVGRLVCLRNEANGCEYETVLINTSQADKLTETNYRCELSGTHKAGALPPHGTCTVSLIFNGVAFERSLAALKTMRKISGNPKCSDMGRAIYDILMGKRASYSNLDGKIPENLDAPGVAALNEIQRNAVKEVLLKPLSLIQGPPGTGKTTTTATIVYHLSRMHGRQILVCAPSNVAVDELTDRIAKTGLNVLRVVARSREDANIDPKIELLTLHYKVDSVSRNGKEYAKYRELVSKRKEFGTLSVGDYETMIVAQKRLEERIIADADVVCCTCVVAADKRLARSLFRHVVIDEATQSQEPETLIPLTMGCEQAILIGDHCQMGPVVMSREASDAGLSRTVFERLVTCGHKPFRLEVQYRMHPELSKFSSIMFYDGALQNGVSAGARDSTNSFPWPEPSKPFFFYHSDKFEELGASGISVLNRTEAHLAEKIVTLLLKSKVRAADIGVITPYEAQRNYLQSHFIRSGQLGSNAYKEVEVASVDSFQGREKEFIIFSCVRSNDSMAIGFLKDWRRLNVALTRARRGVMVIGNARILAQDPTWNSYLVHCQNKNLIVAGSVMKLERLDITIPAATRRNRNNGITEEVRALVRGESGVGDEEEDEEVWTS